MAEEVVRASLNEEAAYQLANVTKTAPQFGAITPRWLVRLLDWKPLESGIFRRNRVVEDKPIDVALLRRLIICSKIAMIWNGSLRSDAPRTANCFSTTPAVTLSRIWVRWNT